MDTYFSRNDRKTEKISAFTSFEDLNGELQGHLKNVYLTLFASLLSAAVGVYINVKTGFGDGMFLQILGTIAMLFWLHSTPHTPENYTKRASILLGVTMLQGFSLGPLVRLAIDIDPSTVFSAVLMTSAIFLSFSGAALYSPRRVYLYLGGWLLSALNMLLIAGLLNIFFGFEWVHLLMLYGGLFVFCGYVLYDTQLIIEKAKAGNMDFVAHSLELFMDFLNIFVRVLVILIKDKKKKE